MSDNIITDKRYTDYAWKCIRFGKPFTGRTGIPINGGSKAEAKKIARLEVGKIDEQIAKGELVIDRKHASKIRPTKVTLGAALDLWWDNHGKTHYANLEWAIGFIKDTLDADTPLASIRNEQVDDLVQARKRSATRRVGTAPDGKAIFESRVLKPRSVDETTKVLRMTLNYMIDNRDFEHPKPPKWKKHMQHKRKDSTKNILHREILPDQLARLREHEHPDWANVALFLLCQGVRIAEALSLQWDENINLKDGLINFNAKGSVARSVPIHPAVKAMLIRLKLERSKDSPWVFTFRAPVTGWRCDESTDQRKMFREQGKLYPIAKSWANYHWRLAREAAGITGKRIHDYRHTFGIRCARLGMSNKAIALMMGHEDPNTPNIYTGVVQAEENRPHLDRMSARYDDGYMPIVVDAGGSKVMEGDGIRA